MDKEPYIYKSAQKAQMILGHYWADLYDDLEIEEEEHDIYLVGQNKSIRNPIKIVAMPQADMSALQVLSEKENAKKKICKILEENAKDSDGKNKHNIFIDCLNCFVESNINGIVSNVNTSILSTYENIYILINSNLHKFTYNTVSKEPDIEQITLSQNIIDSIQKILSCGEQRDD